MGFATFRFEDGRYLLIDCRVYSNAALITQSADNSVKQNGVHLANDLAVCYMYGKPSEDVSYEIILSNNSELLSVARIVNEVRKSAESITGNPSKTVFRRLKTDTQSEVSYELTFDGMKNQIHRGS